MVDEPRFVSVDRSIHHDFVAVVIVDCEQIRVMSLAEHVRAKRITELVAMGAAENKRDLAAALSPRAAASAPTMTHGLFGPKGGKS